MLRVTVELVPFGVEGQKRTLGVAEIFNNGTGDSPAQGNYKARIFRLGRGRAIWKSCELKGFPRRRLGPWDLLLRALVEMLGGRNGVS